MAWGSQRKPSRLARALLVLALLLLAPLSVEYARQASVKRDWRKAEADVLVQLATARAEHAALEADKAFVQTDAYIEQAARERLKLARAGDVVIAIAATPRLPTPQVTPEPTSTAAAQSWLASLFGR